MKPEPIKKQKLIRYKGIVEDYSLNCLQKELGVTKAEIRSAVSAVGTNPEQITYFIKHGKQIFHS